MQALSSGGTPRPIPSRRLFRGGLFGDHLRVQLKELFQPLGVVLETAGEEHMIRTGRRNRLID